MTKTSRWWGEFDFAMGESKLWRIGARKISIKRCLHEWTLHNCETPFEEDYPVNIEDNHLDHLTNQTNAERDVAVKVIRCMTNNTSNQLIIEPSLADRSMTVRPSKPFIIMPEQTVRVFVSTPLWMTVMCYENQAPIADIPFWRPSDSWFGPSTMVGDLCYSKYTDAKMERSQLETRSHRANSIVTIKNANETALTVERLSLPVPSLKLYVDKQNMFWTDEVFISQQIEHNKPVSQLSHRPPSDINDVALVSESRELSNKDSFLSSLKSLIH